MSNHAWREYHKATATNGPRQLLVEALPYTRKREHALDLGSGAGNDARFLLEQGFMYVDAVDSSAHAAINLPEEVHFWQMPFDAFGFPIDTYDLINAQYALPFNGPKTFAAMFTKLAHSLKVDGIFTGQFFGPEDDWSGDPNMTFHSREEIVRLLDGFAIIVEREEKRSGPTALGGDKFWHVFHIIARKK